MNSEELFPNNSTPLSNTPSSPLPTDGSGKGTVDSSQPNWTSILQHYWGYSEFRGIQQEIIQSVHSGKDTLGLMPTGGGKSLTFQVPAMAKRGVCIVITPLIALMKDQVEHLRQRGINAVAIYSGMTHDEILTILENCIFGDVKLLYISPERLSSELFQNKLKKMKVSFITVDEAHCISQWGYDFRPAYLHIAEIRKQIPHVPVLALTATATPAVVDDIQKQLGFKEHNVFRMSFARENLAYVVRTTTDKPAELIHILQHTTGSSIVYVRSRKRSQEIAELLCQHQLSATYYHAGLEHSTKDQRQNDWQSDKVRVMVATNAFGMGIDKADVRTVIHIDTPNSIEAYFQEAGRAGRDGKKAYAVLLYNNNDRQKLQKRIDDTFPDKEYIKEVYDHLAYFFQIGIGSGHGATFEFNIDKFCTAFHHFPIRVNAALVILQRAGYIDYEPNPENQARVKFLLTRSELYRLGESTKDEEAVITALLRNYGGLFTDYAYIDEGYLAQESGLTHSQTYQTLKALGKKHIIDFVPRRNVPLISYLQHRDDGCNLQISRQVYEDRLEQFKLRIHAMLRYAANNEDCRSLQLLSYFGEEKTKNCLHCDVCLAHNSSYLSDDMLAPAKEKILDILSDGKKHIITELSAIQIDSKLIDEALEFLLAEEAIYIDGNQLFMKPGNHQDNP